jgi:exopolysaccharide biosynthesis polyprenyl glycosylphosphotransferase
METIGQSREPAAKTAEEPDVRAISGDAFDDRARTPSRRFARDRRVRLAWKPDLRDIREGPLTDEVLRRDARIRRALAVADLTAASCALGAAAAVEHARPHALVVLALPLIVLLAKLARLYDRDEHVIRKSTLDQAPAVFQVVTVYTLLIWFASDALLTGGLTKPATVVVWVATGAGMLVLRALARRILVRSSKPERLLVLGSAQAAERLGSRIEKSDALPAVLVGRVALERNDRDEPQPLGPLADLDYLLRANHVERVVIAPHQQTSDEQLETIRLVKALGVKVSVLPRLFEVVGSSMEFDDVDGITLLGLRRYGLSKTSWYLKRTFDIIVTTIAAIMFAPLIAVIAAAIAATSPGPILFRQPRVGRRGECFQMLKFRTMYDGADEAKADLAEYRDGDGLFKLVDDPRVTPVGRWLRRTSLDELPQLVNVLRGEMSLVGPRPLIEEEDRKIVGSHHRRREGTPGMTGVWQLLGPTRVQLDDMVKMDYLYRANWSLWLDMKILLRTMLHVCRGRSV